MSKVKTKAVSAKTKVKIKENKKVQTNSIVIDTKKNIAFNSEKEMLAYFQEPMQILEEEFLTNRKKTDLTQKQMDNFLPLLDDVLDKPDSVWFDSKTYKGLELYHFHKEFEINGEIVFYVAITYMDLDVPSFVFLHFSTKDPELAGRFKRTEQIFDRAQEEVEPAAIEGDALTDGDLFAARLFLSMMKLRVEDKDIGIEKFKDFASLREDTVESADEIWRYTDSHGHVLVSFIKEYPDHDVKGLYYVVVTVEDTASEVHSLLFSFPTTDEALVDRYRFGENLQADEVSQESSH